MFSSEVSVCKQSYAADKAHGHFFCAGALPEHWSSAWRETRAVRGAVALSFVFGLMAMLALYAPAANAQSNVTGTWQTLPNQMPINPVHAALMHNGQILVVSGSGNYPQQTTFYVGIWDPSSNSFINQKTQSWDQFCNGMVVLPDGRPMVAGGNLQYDPFHGWNRTTVYDPATGKYSDMEDMVYGRWYPSNLILGDGRMMVYSGLDVNGNTDTHVEIYKVGSGWGAPSTVPWTPPLYPRQHLLPNGKVFYSGATTQSRYFDPSNNTWSSVVATTNYSGTRTYGTSVLFPLTPANGYKPKVIIFGGGNPAVNTTEIIDLSVASPKWTYGPNMSQPRIEMNGTLLPNGKILTLGGSLNDEDTSTASLQADLYDTATNTMASAGSEVYARLYHSVSLLMPDGTVWVAGGNPVRGTYEQHVEVYTPPYLYNSSGQLATRPTITSVSNSVIGYGTSFTVTTPDAANISSVVIMKNGAVTHAFNMDQRLVGLNFTKGSGVLTVTGPPNGNTAPPGYYMIFLLNSSGVPSVAKFVQVSLTPTDTAPKGTITSPTTDITIAPGQSVNFAGTATGTISAYSWVFRGGTPGTSALANPGSVTFATAGIYTAVFTPTDAAGNTDPSPATRTITVTTSPAPVVTGVSPNTGKQGQSALSVAVSGSNFLPSPSCSFGNGITVSSCTYNSATSITAVINILTSAATGARGVTVTNTDAQSSTLANGFTVQTGVNPVPTITSVAPNSGTQGQSNISVVITGTNFLPNPSCDFDSDEGLTASACTYNSATKITATVSITATAVLGAHNVVVTDTDGQSATLTNGFTVNAAAGGGTQQYNFTYANRAALVADGWDFNAKTAAGATRNTEQTGTLAVSYDQTAHPGTIRLPIPIGDIYGATNNSENQLSRNLPGNWTSVRLNIAAFTPTVNYEEVSIVAYQDDDNFVLLGRMYDGTPTVEFYQETAGTPASDAGFKTLTNTRNLILRIDFNAATNTYTAFYSTDGGTTWVANGSIVKTLTAPRLALVVGANYAGTLPTADLSWVQVVTPGMAAAPTLTSVSPNTGAQASTLSSVVLTGTNFLSGPTCSFGAGITVNSCTFNSSRQLTANITIAGSAAVGTRNVTVTDSDGQVATLNGGFSVTTAVTNPPAVSAVNPNTGAQGAALSSVVITGTNFASGAACSFGSGITVNSCAFNSVTQMTANLSISASATVGTRTVTVTNPNTQSGSLANGFSVTAGTSGTQQINFTYANRAALLADGWDFNAKAAAGVTRNTEQTGSLAISYDQTAHPGVIRVPVLLGDIYGSTNNSENTMLRNLPSNWTSIRLNIAAYNPSVNYEQVDIVAYQDDDNFVMLGRMEDGSPTVEFYQETAGTPASDAGFTLLTNTGNLILRMDRNASTNVYTAFYSTDGGTTWVSMGSITKALTNPRLAIASGANYAGTQPTAALSWVQIVTP